MCFDLVTNDLMGAGAGFVEMEGKGKEKKKHRGHLRPWREGLQRR